MWYFLLRYIFFVHLCIVFYESFSGWIYARARWTPLITIITSVYKGDLFIEEFMQDITRQTIYKQCEHIIINANSPGNEEPVIKRYMQQYPNIIYQRLDKDPGLYAVWNMGIRMAQAEFITNANLDDRMRKDALQVKVDALKQWPEVDLVYADYYITRFPNEVFKKHRAYTIYHEYEFSPHNLMYRCLGGFHPMWRKSLHERYGYFDEWFMIMGDWYLWLTAVYNGSKFRKINQILGLVYENPKGLSTGEKTKAQRHRELERIIPLAAAVGEKYPL